MAKNTILSIPPATLTTKSKHSSYLLFSPLAIKSLKSFSFPFSTELLSFTQLQSELTLATSNFTVKRVVFLSLNFFTNLPYKNSNFAPLQTFPGISRFFRHNIAVLFHNRQKTCQYSSLTKLWSV
jgi:hypothetical protein